MTVQIAILRLLVALAKLALEHDRGYASRRVWTLVDAAIKHGDRVLEDT